VITPKRLGYIGPGMSGPEVEEVQRLVKAPVTGYYDEETTQRVRGLQVLHGLFVQDGMFDDELESVLRQTPGMSS
jgi:peptidoglycan hydrolase-like protein with peptidoglycan-binding domain